jgi:hypothetical protein
MVSLLELAKVVAGCMTLALLRALICMYLQVEEEGVTFRSPTDGSMMLLTPERR